MPGTREPTLSSPAQAAIDDRSALYPPAVRRLVLGIIGAMLAFACYLIIVRGPALLLDLAHSAYAMFCL